MNCGSARRLSAQGRAPLAGQCGQRGLQEDEHVGRSVERNAQAFDSGRVSFPVKDTMQSWVDTARFHSLRFIQDFDDDGKERYRYYDMFPDRAMYQIGG